MEIEHDRNKGSKKPALVYSPITDHIYIAYKNELIDVTVQYMEIMKAINKEQEHD